MDFKGLNQALEGREVASFLGLQMVGNKALCCFHPDRNPSMVIYPHRFHCYSCGATNDLIRLTATVLGVSNPEAFQVLNERFSLGFDSTIKTKIATPKLDPDKPYKEWLRLAILLLSDYIRMGQQLIFSETVEPELKEMVRTRVEKAEALQEEYMAAENAKEAFRKGELKRYEDAIRRYEQFRRDFGINR